MTGIAALVLDCFRHALDKKLFWVMFAISTIIALAMACIGIDESGTSILFGLWKVDEVMGREMAAAILTKFIGDIYIGWIGVILALIATAGMIPAFMERGSIDVVLGKPMSRPMTFLGKYLGGMTFVAVQVTYFILVTFLVAGFRWQVWIWGYFWSIPLMVLLYSYVYCFCALFGVVTRSGLASLLLTMLAWVVLWGLQSMPGMIEAINSLSMETGMVQVEAAGQNRLIGDKWMRVARAARWAVPKTQDIPLIAGKLTNAASLIELMMPDEIDRQFQLQDDALRDEELMIERQRLQPGTPAERQARMRIDEIREQRDSIRMQQEQMRKQAAMTKKMEDVPIFASIASSLAFEAVIVLLAMWRFTRRDF